MANRLAVGSFGNLLRHRGHSEHRGGDWVRFVIPRRATKGHEERGWNHRCTQMHTDERRGSGAGAKKNRRAGRGIAERSVGAGVAMRSGQESDKKPRPNHVHFGSRMGPDRSPGDVKQEDMKHEARARAEGAWGVEVREQGGGGHRRCPFVRVIEHPTSNFQHRTPNVERRTLNAERRTPNAERRTSNGGVGARTPLYPHGRVARRAQWRRSALG